MKKIADITALVGAGFLTWLVIGWASGRHVPAQPVSPPLPVQPEPAKPKKPILPWREIDGLVEAKVGGSVSPDGAEEIHCDLPGEYHMHNTGGRDGAGLCVFTSIEHSARHQNVPELIGFQKWMKQHPGGGYPSKVDKMIDRICKERGVPKPAYIQVQGNDLEILKLACKTGRMPGVTYCQSPTGRYGGGRIAHMVSLPHASDSWFCVLDNNYPGENRYEWMSPAEFKRTYTGMGGGWAVILLQPGHPPTPTN